MIQIRVEALGSEILKLINSIFTKERLPYQWKKYTRIILPPYKKGDKTQVSGEEDHCYQRHTKCYSIFFSQD
jgi:hypothetical protein